MTVGRVYGHLVIVGRVTIHSFVNNEIRAYPRRIMTIRGSCEGSIGINPGSESIASILAGFVTSVLSWTNSSDSILNVIIRQYSTNRSLLSS